MKLLFTSVTISAGFKGGEVTNLFFMGAALGNAVGQMFGSRYSYYAGLGLVGVFSGATNTPLACTLLGLEIFGSEFIVIFGIVSFISYIISGWSGVYSKQNVYSIKLFPIFNINNKKDMAEKIGKPSFNVNSKEILTIDKIE